MQARVQVQAQAQAQEQVPEQAQVQVLPLPQLMPSCCVSSAPVTRKLRPGLPFPWL